MADATIRESCPDSPATEAVRCIDDASLEDSLKVFDTVIIAARDMLLQLGLNPSNEVIGSLTAVVLREFWDAKAVAELEKAIELLEDMDNG